MQIIDNINTLWGDDLKQTLKSGTKLKIAASCFSIYAYVAPIEIYVDTLTLIMILVGTGQVLIWLVLQQLIAAPISTTN